MRIPFSILMVTLISTTAIGETADLAALDSLAAKTSTRLRAGIANVRSEVSSGQIQFSTPESCQGKTSCFGNNPSSPYGAVAIQLAAGQPVPPVLPGVDASVPAGHYSYFHFREDDSLILMGYMPTDLKYFGFTPYLFARKDGSSAQYVPVFGAVNDTLNHLVMNSAGGTNGAFGRFIAVIIAAEKNSAARARAALQLEGVPDAVINTQILPKDFPLNLGWQSGADLMGVLFRLGLPTNADVVANYLKNVPIRVLHVTPMEEGSLKIFPKIDLRAVGTGKCEGEVNLKRGCNQTLDSALPRTLQSATSEILARLTGAANQLTEIQPTIVPSAASEKMTLGALCAATLSNCNGDNRDTVYTSDVEGAVLSTDPGDFLLFVGVNHVAYGKATYINHSIYRALTFAGVAAISNLDFLESDLSSIEYHLGRAAKTGTEKNLYAYTVARNCNGRRFCRKIEATGDTSVPLEEPIRVMARMYLEPTTRVKPSENEILFHKIYRSAPKP